MNQEIDKQNFVVMVVDDDPTILTSLTLLISSLGYRTLSAKDGINALELLNSQICDLIITDVVMPRMDGLELLHHVREEYPTTGVIIATGYSSRASYAEVIRAGAIDFIKKPIEHAELEAKLTRALREQQMLRELEKQSLCDELTGLLNRRAFDKRFPREVERAARQHYPLYLAILDVDRFKNYNDTFGHQAGDKVLAAVGDILHLCTRNNVDTCFRYGGDEFAVILPQTSISQAIKVIERILQRFRKMGFGDTDISIGMAPCARDNALPLSEDMAQLIDRADKAMYRAKAKGIGWVINNP
ncbi:MAG: diguanylate cyclase [Proteobacteria bacterium]|nr:diguanylate cyclase [Pseudomonadota bacterium]MBU1058941.1 diguanylate cyclase [Pseudomonadota bacterium]